MKAQILFPARVSKLDLLNARGSDRELKGGQQYWAFVRRRLGLMGYATGQ
jgi:hypothetical protein